MSGQVLQRDAADSCFRVGFYLLLGLGCAIPVAEQETAFLDFLLELLVTIYFAGVGDTEVQCFLVDVLLDLLQQRLNALYDTVHCYRLFLHRVAAGNLDGVVLEVASAHREAHGHTLQLIVGELIARRVFLARVEFHADAERLQLVCQRVQFGEQLIQLLLFLEDRHNHYLYRC